MPIKTKRWNDPAEADDGLRVLITRYRPRGLKKEAETWDAWDHEFAPSVELLADFHGKHGPPIAWDAYERRYLDEMRAQETRIAFLARHVREGGTLTLLCSNACTDAARCHRTLLARLVEKAAQKR